MNILELEEFGPSFRNFEKMGDHMQQEDLLYKKFNVYSQNGEDGIIKILFNLIGADSKVCCEFGAWDGIHFSNCRNLIMDGWKAIMIEGDESKFKELAANYKNNDRVICENIYVDCRINKIGTIIRAKTDEMVDFLSVDIDGLDYEVFETLDFKPRLICIEVNAGHSPTNTAIINREIAKNNIGQSLGFFSSIAKENGYSLVCYSGNAFFLRKDLLIDSSIAELSAQNAYELFLQHLDSSGKDWLYLVNLGLVEPYYKFGNEYLTRKYLGFSIAKAIRLQLKQFTGKFIGRIKVKMNRYFN